MLYFTKYAEQKFDLLNRHKVYFTKEQIEDIIKLPDVVRKKGKNFFARKNDAETVYRKEGGAIKVVTFYPVKQL